MCTPASTQKLARCVVARRLDPLESTPVGPSATCHAPAPYGTPNACSANAAPAMRAKRADGPPAAVRKAIVHAAGVDTAPLAGRAIGTDSPLESNNPNLRPGTGRRRN